MYNYVQLFDQTFDQKEKKGTKFYFALAKSRNDSITILNHIFFNNRPFP